MGRDLRIRVKGKNSYTVVFARGVSEIARDIKRLADSSFVITDKNVGSHYGRHFSGFPLVIVPPGESSKSRRMKERIEDRLLSLKISRESLIIALGGGMVGDLAGFVAATILRGVPYVQVPTSLLAQVDSSIGGKVGVDHPLGKNLIGAFHQPSKVYVCLKTLGTLPEREFRSGLAEVIKYAAILDARLFTILERSSGEILARKTGVLGRVVRRCLELKREIVEKDERETGLRRILNFGHTIGHAVELRSGYRLLHGEAVAIGMAAESRISASCGMLRAVDSFRVEKLLTLYGLPTEMNKNVGEILRATSRDKKAIGGTVRYTLLKGIGRGVPGVPLTLSEVARALG